MARPIRVASMRRIDRAVLEFLHNEGNQEIVANPAVIAVNIDFESDYVRQRMRPLRETGLIEYYDEDRALYQLSDRGRKYITGQMSEKEAERLDEELSQYTG